MPFMQESCQISDGLLYCVVSLSTIRSDIKLIIEGVQPVASTTSLRGVVWLVRGNQSGRVTKRIFTNDNHTLSNTQRRTSSELNYIVNTRKCGVVIREVENECTSHNFRFFAIFLPKIIKIGGHLTKFCVT